LSRQKKASGRRWRASQYEETFASAVNYTVGTGPTALVLADFDSRGNLGVAVANGGSNNVSILIGNGDGTLRTRTNYAAGSDPVGLAVFDGGTGAADLLVSDHASNCETILVDNGNGLFTATQTIGIGESPTEAAVATFANNGVPYAVVDNVILILALVVPAQTEGIIPGNGTFVFDKGGDHTIAKYKPGTKGSGKVKLDMVEANVLVGTGDESHSFRGVTTPARSGQLFTVIDPSKTVNKRDLSFAQFAYITAETYGP
jgi:hypothetical protein